MFLMFLSQYEFKLKNIKKKKVNIVVSTGCIQVIVRKKKKVRRVKCDLTGFIFRSDSHRQPVCFRVITEKRVVMG